MYVASRSVACAKVLLGVSRVTFNKGECGVSERGSAYVLLGECLSGHLPNSESSLRGKMLHLKYFTSEAPKRNVALSKLCAKLLLSAFGVTVEKEDCRVSEWDNQLPHLERSKQDESSEGQQCDQK